MVIYQIFEKYKYKILFFLLLFYIISAILGYNSNITSQHVDENFKIQSSLSDFFIIFFKNMLVCCLLLLGGTTFQIINFFTVGVNGFILGYYFKSTSLSFGLTKNVFLYLPHTIIEIAWIIMASLVSMNIIPLILNIEKIVICKKILYQIYFLILLVILGAFIEISITPYLFNKIS